MLTEQRFTAFQSVVDIVKFEQHDLDQRPMAILDPLQHAPFRPFDVDFQDVYTGQRQFVDQLREGLQLTVVLDGIVDDTPILSLSYLVEQTPWQPAKKSGGSFPYGVSQNSSV